MQVILSRSLRFRRWHDGYFGDKLSKKHSQNRSLQMVSFHVGELFMFIVLHQFKWRLINGYMNGSWWRFDILICVFDNKKQWLIHGYFRCMASWFCLCWNIQGWVCWNCLGLWTGCPDCPGKLAQWLAGSHRSSPGKSWETVGRISINGGVKSS